MKHALRAVLSLSSITARELLRDRIQYSAVISAVALLIVGILISQFAVVRPDRVLLDFGLAAVTWVEVGLALVLGGVLIEREWTRRTATVSLSRPISRAQFVCGKYLGLIGILTVNGLALSAVMITAFLLHGGTLNETILCALSFAILQSWMIASVSLCLGCLSKPSLAILVSIGVYIAGINVPELQLLATKLDPSALKTLLEWIVPWIPNFGLLSLGLKVTYGVPITLGFGIMSSLYALSVSALWVALGALFLRKRIL